MRQSQFSRILFAETKQKCRKEILFLSSEEVSGELQDGEQAIEKNTADKERRIQSSKWARSKFSRSEVKTEETNGHDRFYPDQLIDKILKMVDWTAY